MTAEAFVSQRYPRCFPQQQLLERQHDATSET